jgi:hypothetical protein
MHSQERDSEFWPAVTKEKAIQLLIRYARELNDEYISIEDIAMYDSSLENKNQDRVRDALALLDGVDRGEFVVLHKNHYLVKYRITQDEADLIVGIREGKHLLQALSDPPCTEDEDNDFLKELRSIM